MNHEKIFEKIRKIESKKEKLFKKLENLEKYSDEWLEVQWSIDALIAEQTALEQRL